MPAIPTKILTDLEPDDAHQASSATFDAQDRQKIDTQIRGCQQHLAELLINGIIGTWARIASSSPALTEGDVVCLAGVASGEPTVTLATAAAIVEPGAAYGVVLAAASPGARVQIAVNGILPPSITGLATTAGNVRVSSVGRPERVDSFSTGDYPIGAVNSLGYMTIARATVVASVGGGSGDVDPTPDTLALRDANGELRAEWVEVGSGTKADAGDIRGAQNFEVIARVAIGGGENARVIGLTGTTLEIGADNTSTRVNVVENGDATFAHGAGPTTFFRARSTSACSQPGDLRFDPATGHPYVYIDVAGETALLAYKVPFQKPSADGSAAAAFAELPVMGTPGFLWTLAGAVFIPSASLTSDASNYATMTVSARNAADGGYLSDAAVGVTRPSGTNATGDWTAWVPVALTVQSAYAAFASADNDYLTFKITKTGSGVIVPAGILVLAIVPWQEP